MIEVRGLTKRYGGTVAVDGLTFDVRPGEVTGFLGPNGAGKSTTMRLVLGLDRPDAGTATVCGRAYRDLPQPLRTVGALLESRATHPGRSGYDHLLVLAQTHRIPRQRVGELLELVGLREVARRHVGEYSLGMTQRLGIAAALLGDPRVVLLDEPVNGLDPDGIRWVRALLTHLAGEGRTVLVSSHLLTEVALTATRLVVIDHGRLRADSSTADFIARSGQASVRVVSPDHERLATALRAAGGEVEAADHGGLTVVGLSAAAVGELAAREHAVLHELVPQEASLEQAFMDLVGPEADAQQEAPRAWGQR